jgi:2-C-methyl-D-erythritol 2,4-cyclodiphosphate synthase
MRVGIGYDVHRLVAGRALILGGTAIPFKKGLLGHSDADVLVHAVCDALLGAAGMGDIGLHFPDSDPKFKDISSLKLLAAVAELIRGDQFAVANIDVTLFAEAPKIGSYRERMRQNLAGTLSIEPSRVNIKATTTEGLGYIGRGDGIAAMSVVLLKQNEV